MNTTEITIGSRGCGKMEQMRKASGMTYSELKASIHETERQLSEAAAYRESQHMFWNTMWAMGAYDG